MKVMWLCNTPLPDIYDIMHIKSKGTKEGWLVGISNQLSRRENVEFYYVFPQNSAHRTIKVIRNNISFIGYYSYKKNGSAYITDKRNEDSLKKIIDQIKPDIIHIFGTEIHHTLECINAVSYKNNIVVSIQGLVSECMKHYCDGIPLKNILDIEFNDLEWDSILKEKYQFFRRGINERKSLRMVRHVIGRTDWDRECVKKINPLCEYHYCSETLRDIFYQGNWDIQGIEKYSILVSQGSYPIKGLHIMINALPHILKIFPETKLYVTGDKTFLDKTAYGKYVRKIIRKQRIEKYIRFKGFIGEKEMLGMMHKSNVMVLPSTCENSPNSIGEAMLIGLPVVASNVGGVSSVAHNGHDALLFQPCDYIGLAKRVCAVFSNGKTARMLSRNGKKTALRLYDRTGNMEQLLGIYQQIHEEVRE